MPVRALWLPACLPAVALAAALAATSLLVGPQAQATAAAPAPPRPRASPRPSGRAPAQRASRKERNLLTRVNRARSHARTCGRVAYAAAPPLRLDTDLGRAARRHARDMARHDYFDHTGRSGSTPASRARAAGYRGTTSENIAAGYRRPAQVMRAWLASPGHCANIMSRSNRHLGAGYAYDAGSPYRGSGPGLRATLRRHGGSGP